MNLRGLIERATPAPWRFVPNSVDTQAYVQRGLEGGFQIRGLSKATEDADAEIIVYLVNNAPAISELIEAANGAKVAELNDRITGYLESGGLFNPELAIHDHVRDLLMECRAELARIAALAKLNGGK